MQHAEHDKRAGASGIGPGYALTFAARDIQGKQHAVIAGIHPLPTHNNLSVMLVMKFADNL